MLLLNGAFHQEGVYADKDCFVCTPQNGACIVTPVVLVVAVVGCTHRGSGTQVVGQLKKLVPLGFIPLTAADGCEGAVAKVFLVTLGTTVSASEVAYAIVDHVVKLWYELILAGVPFFSTPTVSEAVEAHAFAPRKSAIDTAEGRTSYRKSYPNRS